MADLMGKVAIVTGARGIGLGIAEHLGRDGASVVVNYSGSQQEAEDVVAAIKSNGGMIALQVNMSRVDDIRRLFQETLDRVGQLDILVNNAGTGIVASVAPVAEEDYDKVFNLNARGVLFAYGGASV